MPRDFSVVSAAARLVRSSSAPDRPRDSAASHEPVQGAPMVSCSDIATSMQDDKQLCKLNLRKSSSAVLPRLSTQALVDGKDALRAEVDAAGMSQETKDHFLRKAILAGRADLMTACILGGANANASYTPQKGSFPLILAVRCKVISYECVKVLVDRLTAEEINRMSSDGLTPLTSAAGLGRTEIVTLLADKLETPEAINRPRRDGSTALMLAAANSQVEAIRVLRKWLTSVEINQRRPDGYTPLMKAAKRGHAEVVKALMKKLSAEEMNLVLGTGHTALILAARDGHTEAVRLLSSKLTATEINFRDSRGRDAMKRASENSHTEVVQVLQDRLNDLEAIHHARLFLEKVFDSEMAREDNIDRLNELEALR